VGFHNYKYFLQFLAYAFVYIVIVLAATFSSFLAYIEVLALASRL
jgi:hypothetical protein